MPATALASHRTWRTPTVTMPPPSAKVRFYLAGFVGFRFALLAITFWVSADRLAANDTFDVVQAIAPLRTVVFIFALVAIAAFGGALWPRERPTRALLLMCSIVELLFGLALLFSWTWSPSLAAFLPCVVADVIVSGIDYRPKDRT